MYPSNACIFSIRLGRAGTNNINADIPKQFILRTYQETLGKKALQGGCCLLASQLPLEKREHICIRPRLDGVM